MGGCTIVGRLLPSLLVILKLHSVSTGENIHHIAQCGAVVTLTKSEGTIISPNYPASYPSHCSCTWIIESPPKTVLTIRVLDLDIENDSRASCIYPPCCLHAWLSLPREGGQGSQQLCGRTGRHHTVAVAQPKTSIKFHTMKVIQGGRGFNLSYIIEAEHVNPCLGPDEVSCGGSSPDCYNNVSQRCDGAVDCPSGHDEIGCPCGPNHFPCRESVGCITHSQLCDSKPDCADYSDEIDCHPSCPGWLLCSDRKGCYSPAERCDAVTHCADGSDELDCPRELCATALGRSRCDNGQCISNAWWCNGVPDCSDHSDEQGCVKNSVITAAIMGSLICGLLLVIAVGCMCRLYSLRLASGSPYRPEAPIVPAPDEDFFHREPPPAYSVAIGDVGRLPPRLFTLTASEYNPGTRGRRSSRRHNHRRRAHRPHHLVPPPARTPVPALETSLAAQREAMIVAGHVTDDKLAGASHAGMPPDSPASCVLDLRPEGEASSPPRSSSTSTSGSPSRESITSSTSLLSYVSGNDDDTQLLVLPPS